MKNSIKGLFGRILFALLIGGAMASTAAYGVRYASSAAIPADGMETETADMNRKSWELWCSREGADPSDVGGDEYSRYIDTYAGSAQEEEDFPEMYK